jgi:pimeloyl-ACP methyl ester carboxylesterase
LHANYASNFDRYEEWHDYFRRYQPPTLVVWGEGDFVFGVPGAKAYQRDLRTIETHVLPGAAHFALETHATEIAEHIRRFLGRNSFGNCLRSMALSMPLVERRFEMGHAETY